MRKKLHVAFSGQVQGIGFRASVKNWAEGLGLAGWVRNNPDGSVELEAEGEESILQSFLTKILQSQLQRYITSHQISWQPAEANEGSTLFRVEP
ncbi:MAG: acylphosphatase [bacterium]|nr:acylphosphatase [bacterium]